MRYFISFVVFLFMSIPSLEVSSLALGTESAGTANDLGTVDIPSAVHTPPSVPHTPVTVTHASTPAPPSPVHHVVPPPPCRTSPGHCCSSTDCSNGEICLTHQCERVL